MKLPRPQHTVRLLLVALLAVTALTTPAQAVEEERVPQVLPALSGWLSAAGQFSLSKQSRVVANAARKEAVTFTEDAREAVGRRLNVVGGKAKAGDIVLAVDP